MNTANNILLVRVNSLGGFDYKEMRDNILESVRLGVLILGMDDTCEIMELPPLGGVELMPMSERPTGPDLPEPEPDTEPMNVELRGGRGAKEKKIIQDRLISYRKKHGLGCWKKVAEASGGRLSEEDLRGLYEGAPFTLASWRIAEMALDALEGKSNDPDRA